jgi:hypothetical protein
MVLILKVLFPYARIKASKHGDFSSIPRPFHGNSLAEKSKINFI